MSFTNSIWPYRPYAPLQIPASSFRVYISALEARRIGSPYADSAAGWLIRTSTLEDVTAHEEKSTSLDSNRWRGLIAAGARGLELLPYGSEAVAVTDDPTLLDLLNRIDPLHENGWKNSTGRLLSSPEILDRLWLARTRLSAPLVAEFPKPHEEPIMEMLKARIRVLLRKGYRV